MTTITGANGTDGVAAPPARAHTDLGPWAMAGAASLGAGAVHAAAVGVHAENQQAARTFAALAVLQIAWGAASLVSRSRLVAAVGLVLSAGAVGGWLLAKTSGISFVEGMGTVEAVQLPDALAAGLAGFATLVLARGLVVGLSGRSLSGPPRQLLHGVGVVVLIASLVGLSEVGSHSHAGGHGDSEVTAGGGHSHGDGAAAGGEGDDEGDEGTAAHQHAALTVPPKRYDPDEPIDLSGVEGVTLAQQARAENLIAITLDRLPRFADTAYAESLGYRSIGDGFTGHEHYINWDYTIDEHVLNPDYPESLVYDTTGPEKVLVSAMFMTDPGLSLDEVPELGGPLTQWHVHEDLCFTDDPDAPRVASVVGIDQECRPPLQKFPPTPMIHVWITPHPCGPFAALEGVAAGQVKEGEEHLCNTLHGH